MADNKVDIFDFEHIDSLMSKLAIERDDIDLSRYDIPVYQIPNDYDVVSFQIDRKNHAQKIRSILEPVVQISEKFGFPSQVFTALYETVLNAFQHGNSYDSKKNITLAHKIKENLTEFAVIDEGGIIDSQFINYVLWHREGMYVDKFINFYDFSHKEPKSPDNLGAGTTLIHNYMDEISYYKSNKNGLVVHLTKEKVIE